MKFGIICGAILFAVSFESSVLAQEKAKPVRMGCGIMTFDTVPGWGLRPDGKSALGPTHGAVVVDKSGNIYTSANAGVFVFSPEGQVIHSYLGKEYSNVHDMRFAMRRTVNLFTEHETLTQRESSSTSKAERSYSNFRSPRNRVSTSTSSIQLQSRWLPTVISFYRTVMPATISSSSTRPASTSCTSERKGMISSNSILHTE